jgi:predicted nucleotidyltransferase
MEALSRVVEADSRLGFAVLFGSEARGGPHARSDLDVAVAAREGHRLTALDLGDIASRLEAATGRPVDVVDLGSAPPGLAYRIFRDGRVILERERPRLVARRARAVLEYLDFKPVEDQFVRGVLAASASGR